MRTGVLPKRSQMKTRKPPLEFSFTTDTFNLELQTTHDGERIERERQQSLGDRAAAEQRQAPLGIREEMKKNERNL